jgi:hypothetical protein
MSGNYRVCSPDGKEFFVSQVSTLQALFRSGRINAETRVLVPGDEKYRPLREIVNLGECSSVNQTPVQVNQVAGNFAQPLIAPTAPIPPATYHYVDGEDMDDRPNRGLRAAGILLLVNAVFVCVGLILSVLKGDQFTLSRIAPVVLIADLIIGSGLVFGKWQSLGLVRATAGGIVFGFIIPMYAEGPSDLLVGVLQILTACGLFVLIYGKRASTTRIVLGISIVIVSWFSIQTVNAIEYLMPKIREASEAGLDKNALTDRSFKDAEDGVSAELPDGWMQVKVAAVLEHKHARMVFSNRSVGAQVVFRVQNFSPSTGITTSTDYMDAMIRQNSSMINLGVTSSNFGQMLSGDPPKRMEISDAGEGQRWHGWITVCKRGNTFYELAVDCAEDNKGRVYSEYLKLESAFKIDKMN